MEDDSKMYSKLYCPVIVSVDVILFVREEQVT